MYRRPDSEALIMKARELIGTAQVPGGEPLRLFRRGDDFMIVLDRNELMNSRMSGSEEALALMTLERLGGRVPSPHVLIGGYGMGFTLRAALGALPSTARATVAELVPTIIEWARGPMADLTAGCLDDRRVTIVQSDVAEVIQAGRATYDAILLDVDNGPDGLVRPRRGFRPPPAQRGLRCRRGRRPRAQQRQGAAPRHLVRAAGIVWPAGLYRIVFVRGACRPRRRRRSPPPAARPTPL
jgi:hypothetical protein